MWNSELETVGTSRWPKPGFKIVNQNPNQFAILVTWICWFQLFLISTQKFSLIFLQTYSQLWLTTWLLSSLFCTVQNKQIRRQLVNKLQKLINYSWSIFVERLPFIAIFRFSFGFKPKPNKWVWSLTNVCFIQFHSKHS